MLMYGSALFYDISRLSPIMQKIMLVNPIYISITIARQAIMYGKYSDITMWFVLASYSTCFYVIGTIYFNKQVDNIVAKI